MAGTKYYVVILLALALPLLTLAADDPKPIMIIDLFRHGARGPYDGTWDPQHLWNGVNGHYGELSSAGIRQHYILGRAIANDYPHLISIYNPNQIQVRSTDVNRTIMSAYSQLYGLFFEKGEQLDQYKYNIAYPPNLSDKNFTNLDAGNLSLPYGLQPVPVHTLPLTRDYLLSQENSCNSFAKLHKEQVNSSRFKEFQMRTNSTIKLIEDNAKRLNITLGNIWTYQSLADTLMCNYRAGFEYPIDIKVDSDEWKEFVFWDSWMVTYLYTGSEKVLQVTASNLLAQMLDILKKKIEGKYSNNVMLYSAHDVTLLPVLATLGITDEKCLWDNYFNGGNNTDCVYPDFAANFITELYNDTEKGYVKFKYNGNYINVCKNDKSTCGLDEYEKLVNDKLNGYTFADFQADCLTTNTENQKQSLVYWMIAVAAICIVEAIILVTLLRRTLKKAPRSRSLTEQMLINA